MTKISSGLDDLIPQEQKLLALQIYSIWYKYFLGQMGIDEESIYQTIREKVEHYEFFITTYDDLGGLTLVEFIKHLAKESALNQNTQRKNENTFGNGQRTIYRTQGIATQVKRITNPKKEKVEKRKRERKPQQITITNNRRILQKTETTPSITFREKLLKEQGIHLVSKLKDIQDLIDNNPNSVIHIHLSGQDVVNINTFKLILNSFANLKKITIVPSYRSTYELSILPSLQATFIQKEIEVCIDRVSTSRYYVNPIEFTPELQKDFLLKQQIFKKAIENQNNPVINYLQESVSPYYYFAELYLGIELQSNPTEEIEALSFKNYKTISQIAIDVGLSASTVTYYIDIFLYMCGYKAYREQIELTANNLIKKIEAKINAQTQVIDTIWERKSFGIKVTTENINTNQLIIPPQSLPKEKWKTWKLLMEMQIDNPEIFEALKSSDFLTLCHRYGLYIFKTNTQYEFLTHLSIANGLIENQIDGITSITCEGVRQKEVRTLHKLKADQVMFAEQEG